MLPRSRGRSCPSRPEPVCGDECDVNEQEDVERDEADEVEVLVKLSIRPEPVERLHSKDQRIEDPGKYDSGRDLLGSCWDGVLAVLLRSC